jgi:hypothetical protein
VFAVVLPEIVLVSNIDWCVDNFGSIVEIRLVSEFELVVNIDVCDEIESLFTIVADAVDNIFVCSIEVEPVNISVVVVLNVTVVLSSLNIVDDEGKEKCSVELETFLFAVDSELVVRNVCA